MNLKLAYLIYLNGSSLDITKCCMESNLYKLQYAHKLLRGKEDVKYLIHVKQIAKFVVGLHNKMALSDTEEGMIVEVDRSKFVIHLPLPAKIDPDVIMITVGIKPNAISNDVGVCKDQIEKMREVVEMPLLHPEKFVEQGIDPSNGVLFMGIQVQGKLLKLEQ